MGLNRDAADQMLTWMAAHDPEATPAIGLTQPSLPASLSPEDVEEWLAAEESAIPLTPDGPAENGAMSFNGGTVTLYLE